MEKSITNTTKQTASVHRQYKRFCKDHLKDKSLYKTKPYVSYYNMMSRVFNNRVPQYKYYGGRGITVCKRWKESFNNFIEDMGFPTEGYDSLDRIDVNGDYTPSNCRWTDWKTQCNNRRKRNSQPKT